jgi:hypothetical protein
MSWRTPVFFVYCGLLLAGTSFLAQRDKLDHRFKAQRTMAVNHSVQAGEVAAVPEEGGNPDSLKGRFALSTIRQGQWVRAGDFAEAPLLRAPTRVTLELPVSGTIGVSNAGDSFVLCEGSKPDPVETVPVAALMCEGEGAARKNCKAVIHVEPGAAARIIGKISAVAAKPANPGCQQEPANGRETKRLGAR